MVFRMENPAVMEGLIVMPAAFHGACRGASFKPQK